MHEMKRKIEQEDEWEGDSKSTVIMSHHRDCRDSVWDRLGDVGS